MASDLKSCDLGRIGIWTASFDGHPANAVIGAAQRIERHGFATVWVPEALGRDPFVLASVILAATKSLKVATGIANVWARDPVAMHAAQQSLAEAYPGRFVLGLGVSSPALVEKVRGHTYDRPLTYMRNYLMEMDTARYRAVRADAEPPRLLGALGPRMLELSSSHADGAHPYLTTPEHTASARATVGSAATLAPEQKIVLTTDAAHAREVGSQAIGSYLTAPGYLANLERLGFSDADWQDPRRPSGRLVDALVAWGGPEQVGARIREHLDAGADHVAVQVLRADAQLPLAEWEQLSELLR